VYKYDFVKYDDDVYVTDNKNIQSGLNEKSINWALTSGYASNWHPLTWMSHILDYQLYQKWAGGHHITNILFHILNTILLFYFLKKATSSFWPSAFVAAAFALHPLHVESVAWIAERKDVLSTFFWILTMLAYVKYAKNIGQTHPSSLKLQRTSRSAPTDPAIVMAGLNKKYPLFTVRGSAPTKWYIATILFFALGLMSKPMLVTIPFVLLLIDYWPLERKFSIGLLVEKIPFLILSIISSIITFIVQQRSGAVTKIEYHGIKIWAENIIVSYAEYIFKMIWPSKLAVLYQFPVSGLPVSIVLISAIVLLAITFAAIRSGRRHKFILFGWLWYVGTLVPVIGFIQIGAHSMADRYTYVPLIGIFVIIFFGAKELFPKHAKILFLAGIAVLAAWSFTSAGQVRYWKDSLTLFEHTISVTEKHFIIMSNYAASLHDAGRDEESMVYIKKLIEMKPDSAENHNSLGSSLYSMGKIDEAIEEFQLALKYKPYFPQAYYNFGIALQKNSNFEKSAQLLQKAIEQKADYIDAYINLALCLNQMQKFDQSIEVCTKALQLEPQNVFLHGYLAIAFGGAGKIDEAIKEIQYVLTQRPNDSQMYRNLGILLNQKGLKTQAIEAYRKSIQIDPNDKNVRWLLEKALKEQDEQQK
jgi:tetratricopeptide (TPR) repeat protein